MSMSDVEKDIYIIGIERMVSTLNHSIDTMDLKELSYVDLEDLYIGLRKYLRTVENIAAAQLGRKLARKDMELICNCRYEE